MDFTLLAIHDLVGHDCPTPSFHQGFFIDATLVKWLQRFLAATLMNEIQRRFPPYAKFFFPPLEGHVDLTNCSISRDILDLSSKEGGDAEGNGTPTDLSISLVLNIKEGCCWAGKPNTQEGMPDVLTFKCN